VPPDELLGALLAYRIIYYLIPFGAALALLGAHELWRIADPWCGSASWHAPGSAP